MAEQPFDLTEEIRKIIAMQPPPPENESQSTTLAEKSGPTPPTNRKGAQIPGSIPTESDISPSRKHTHESIYTNGSETDLGHGDGYQPSAACQSRGCCDLAQRGIHLQPTAHATVVASLTFFELMTGQRQGFTDKDGSTDEDEIPVLIVCALLMAMLFTVQLRSLLRRQTCLPPRLVLAVLHAALAVSATHHRLHHDGCDAALCGDSWLALLLGNLQLLSMLLYSTSCIAGVLMTAVSVAALLLHQALWHASAARPAWECHAFLFSLLAVSLVAVSQWGGQRLLSELFFFHFESTSALVQRIDIVDKELREAFQPIFSLKDPIPNSDDSEDSPQVGTYFSYILGKIASTTNRVHELTSLRDSVRTVLVDALGVLAKELGSTGSLHRIPGAAFSNASPAIVEYVNTVLHPSAAGASLKNTPTPPHGDLDSLPTPRYVGTDPNGIAQVGHEEFAESYGEAVGALTSVLNPPNTSTKAVVPRMNNTQLSEFLASASYELGTWHMNVFEWSERAGGRLLPILASNAAGDHAEKLGIEGKKVTAFLDAIDDRYVKENLYHNSLHAFDVMNSFLYFLRLPTEPMPRFDHLERLTSLMVACAHDVGHPGKANRYHTVLQMPLARLFNDQSVLENMHCAIMFAMLKVEASNALDNLDMPSQAVFRNLAVQMILNTDLAKHVKIVSQFRQDWMDTPKASDERNYSPAQRQDVLSFLLKCADAGGCTKSFNLHAQWTMRIFSEFYAQGDAESAFGVPCSPFCDRHNTSLRECQKGFFDFVAAPMYGALGDFLQSPRIQFEVLVQMEANRNFWRTFDDIGVDHGDPMANVTNLQSSYQRSNQRTCASLTKSASDGRRLNKNLFASDPAGTAGTVGHKRSR